MDKQCNLIFDKSQSNQLNSTVGNLYPTIGGATSQLRSKDALTHNVNTVWLVEGCKSKKMYINIHSSLMYNGTKIISTPQTFRQLFSYSCLKYRDLLFMIFTLQNSITAVWLKQWLQFALSHIQYRKTFQQCDMCALSGLKFTAKLLCNISVQQWHFVILPHSSHTLNNTSTRHVTQSWSIVVLNLYIRQQEAIFCTKTCWFTRTISLKFYLTKVNKWITYCEDTKHVQFQPYVQKY